MSTVEKSIEANVPVSTAYNQWTQFEEFPRFIEPRIGEKLTAAGQLRNHRIPSWHLRIIERLTCPFRQLKP